MREKNTLYNYVYQSILLQIHNGSLRSGDQIPAQQEICHRYHVGITTVRKVMSMLKKNGFIKTIAGKRSTIIYDGEINSQIATLLERKNSILDLYRSLELLMPLLYAEASVHLKEYAKLESIIKDFHETMHPWEIEAQSALFFNELLNPFHNQVLLDLHVNTEHFVRLPHLSVPEESPFAVCTADSMKTLLQSIFDLIVKQDAPALMRRIEEMYSAASKETKRYLEALEKRRPCDTSRISFHWDVGNVRTHSYTVIARKLFRRIQKGEFASGKYLPSLTQLMNEYNISQATTLSAIGLLNDIDVVETLDKKGTILLGDNKKFMPLRSDPGIIEKNLTLFLDAFQIFALMAGKLANTILSEISQSSLEQVNKKWTSLREQIDSNLLIRILLDFFNENLPYDSLKNIFGQLDDLLIWGHYLERKYDDQLKSFDAATAREFDGLLLALESRDTKTFSGYCKTFCTNTYNIARRVTVSYGIDPKRLPIALSEK